MNYSAEGLPSVPIISYHGYYSRRTGCAGAGKDYVYVDTDGDVHSCPFCRNKLFSGMDDQLAGNLRQLKSQGCRAFGECIPLLEIHLSQTKKDYYESD